MHSGLGKSQKIDILEVTWPGGKKQTLKDIPVNQYILVKEKD
jgi:hypothetical protein